MWERSGKDLVEGGLAAWAIQVARCGLISVHYDDNEFAMQMLKPLCGRMLLVLGEKRS